MNRSLARAFLTLYITLGVVVLVQSVQTFLDAQRGTLPAADRHHALILGAIEAVAAILFLTPRTMQLGAIALLAIFALAFGLHAVGGDLHLTLLVYAAGVAFVLAHGLATRRRSVQ